MAATEYFSQWMNNGVQAQDRQLHVRAYCNTPPLSIAAYTNVAVQLNYPALTISLEYYPSTLIPTCEIFHDYNFSKPRA